MRLVALAFAPLTRRCTSGICRFFSTATPFYDPLRILFCGSDEFSAASLKALYEEHKKDENFVGSLDVVCREGKASGRGLKTVRDVPIKSLAKGLALPIHEIPTFTGWNLPRHDQPINLIIAVSFGLLVPPRLLKQAKYGGLNVHPSLLPDLYGPAPLHHTLLQGRTRSGITIQTLHPRHFDRGDILLQKPFELPNGGECSLNQLEDFFAGAAPQLLVESLRTGEYAKYNSPDDRSTTDATRLNTELVHARKISPEDCHIDWQTWSAERVLRVQRAMGYLWSKIRIGSDSGRFRVQWHNVTCSVGILEKDLILGRPQLATSMHDNAKIVVVKTCDEEILRIGAVTVEGKKKNTNVAQALKL